MERRRDIQDQNLERSSNGNGDAPPPTTFNYYMPPSSYDLPAVNQINVTVNTENQYSVTAPEYHPINGNYRQNLALMNNSPLELEFQRFGISSPHNPPTPIIPASAYNGGLNGIPVLDEDFSQDYNFSGYEDDLQRMRVQSAARAQFGLYLQQQQPSNLRNHQNSINGTNLNGFGYDFGTNNLINGSAAAASMINRYPPPPPPPRAYRNGGFGMHYNELGLPNQYLNPTRITNNNGYRAFGGTNNNNNVDEFMLSGNLNNIINGSSLRSRVQRQSTTNNNNTYTSLEELRGNIFDVAKDQYGCRFLQKKFEDGNPEDIHMIFLEVKDRVRDLMVDPFGNYLIQKLFEVCNEDQMTELLTTVVKDERNLVAVCYNIHGTRAMQSLLENLKTHQQRAIVVSVLRRIAVSLAKSTNGHHVIRHCLNEFPTQDTKHILDVIADQCMNVATDKNGCCLLQQCLGHAQGEPLERLLAEITSNVLLLSQHEFGNYVVQYTLALRIPHVTATILAQLSGQHVNLSLDKFGSNVVEKCLRESEDDQVEKIIKELIASSRNFLTILQDQYGNYVVQCALSVAKGEIRVILVDQIQVNYAFLHSHPHGKRVLARTKVAKQQQQQYQYHHRDYSYATM